MEDGAFGPLLRAYRRAAGLSQEALAERARLSPGAISTLERSARRGPQQQTLQLIADALELDDEDRARLAAAASAGRRRGPSAAPGGENDGAGGNLPLILTSFHGRDALLDDLDRLLAARRLVTLVGAAGVGKTRAALESAHAHALREAFEAGVWFADLAPIAEPELVTAAIARLFGVRQKPGEPLLDALIANLRAKRILLLLDNCEHVVDACAAIAEALLRACPGVVVLVTSREALRIDGECVVRVAPLAYDGESSPAFQLLADRLADADFVRFATLAPDEQQVALSVCARLDGIPLALELAAGRAQTLSLGEIAAGLDARFALLSEGRRTARSRRETLAGMIDWSFDLLAPAERRLFTRLGIFATSFSAAAATDVAADGETVVVDTLAALVGKSLVTLVERGAAPPRYRLLETMRAYALERLRASGEFDTIAARFARFALATAKAADARYGRVSNTVFLAAVEPDLDNFRSALEWALGHEHDPAVGADLAGSMGWIYRQTALLEEGMRWAERGLAAAPVPQRVAGRLHMALSFYAFNLGELQRALDAAYCATREYRGAGADAETAWALTQEVYCRYLLGTAAEARSAAEEAIALARAAGDTFRLAGALNAFALTIPIERAAERFAPLEEAIRSYRAAGDEGALVPTANLAEAHYAAGNYEAALACGLDVVAMTRANFDRSNLSAALTNVAAYSLTVDDVDQAEAAAWEALTLVRELGKTLNAMCALQHAGSVAALRGDARRAARLLGASNRLYREFGLTRELTEQRLYDRTDALLRAQLSEAELKRLLAQGAAVATDAAIGEALAEPRYGSVPSGPVAKTVNQYPPS